ncbi:MAG: epimerase [Actinobacteria bacterium]|nr:MAG: epimerase [Actinomycetota bacterium]
MKLLVLGGTKFLGRAAVEAALARGDEVTLFNRGETNPELFPEAEKLRGDRDGGLSALEGREWDAVIDPSGYVPRVVRASAELLRGSVGHYVFVSSASVYAEPYVPGFDESAPTVELENPESEDVIGDYGALKAACEQVVGEVFPDASTNVRAGLIVGPHDQSGRFTYWPLRISLGGPVLAPAPPEQLVQFVDVRDLGAWLVDAAARRVAGTFNATGEPIRLDTVLAACGDAELVWVDEQFLLDQGIGPWMELPLWVPREAAAFLQMSVAAAVAAGLRFRPVEETARDTLAWAREVGAGLVAETTYGNAGLDPAREAELLAAWLKRA